VEENMAVVARFYVQTVTKKAFNTGALNVILAPVTRGQENKSWASATPSGRIELTIQNESAAKWFDDRLAKEVAITFEDRPEICALCPDEVEAQGPNVGHDVQQYHVDKVPSLKLGQAVHARCFMEAVEAK
jgi:hypothetical protein